MRGFLANSALALTALAITAAPAWAVAPELDVASVKDAVDARLDQTYPKLDALYKDIHAHPELGFQETRTAARLADMMRTEGFEVTTGVGKTGIVALYRNGPGPTVLVRTELDALPLQEKTGLSYASFASGLLGGRLTPVDHACGHDAHMAAWVGTADALVAMKSRWHGILVFIGQPAEELVSGARAMLKDGLFTRFPKPDYGFALHTGPQAYGNIFYKPGVLTSNADGFKIMFHGRGGHGASPDATLDPIVMAARFIEGVQTLVSREKSPSEFGVVTVGSVNSGTVGNIIPDQAALSGTIRSFDPEIRKALKAGVMRVANAVAAMSAAPPPEVAFDDGATAVVNDQALSTRTAQVFKAAFGAKAVLMPRPINPSEDYSEYINAGVPSFYFLIGSADPARVAAAEAGGPPIPQNHNPGYAPVPEPTIRTGVEAMSLAVVNIMR